MIVSSVYFIIFVYALSGSSHFSRAADHYQPYNVENISDTVSLLDFNISGSFLISNTTELSHQIEDLSVISNISDNSIEVMEINGTIQFDNATYDENLSDSFQVNFTARNQTYSKNNVTNNASINEKSSLRHFTKLSNIMEDIKLYNDTDVINFINRFEIPDFIGSSNESEFDNFTKRDQFKSFNFPADNAENILRKKLEPKLKYLENINPSTNFDRHIIVKRESDASFQREIDEFDEEAIQNQTLSKIQNLPANESILFNAESTNATSNTENNIEEPFGEFTEEPEGPTVYPYTDKDGLIDVVADNGIKYISSESDNFPRSGEVSGNLAGITDDSEPMHYVISGESNLSEDSRKEVGIEDLLPDYVKPTVSGESGNDIGVIETATSSEEIVLSESEEEPTTTTTEAVTWPVNSREYKGENYESKEETVNEDLERKNETKFEEEDTSLNMEYRDEEENQIPRNVYKHSTTGHSLNASSSTKPTIDVVNNNTQKPTTTSRNTEHPNLTSFENEHNTSENFISIEPDSSSEYDPWGTDEPSPDDNKSVIGNSIDLDEIKRNGEQVEMISMTFDSSSDNSSSSLSESDKINDSSSDYESESTHSDKSKVDYDIVKRPSVNMNPTPSLNQNLNGNRNLENITEYLNKTDIVEVNSNQTFFSPNQLNKSISLNLPNESFSPNQSNESFSANESNEKFSPNQSNESFFRNQSNENFSPNQSNERFSQNQSNESFSLNQSNERFSPNQSNDFFPNQSNENFSPNQSNERFSPNQSNESFSPNQSNESTTMLVQQKDLQSQTENKEENNNIKMYTEDAKSKTHTHKRSKKKYNYKIKGHSKNFNENVYKNYDTNINKINESQRNNSYQLLNESATQDTNIRQKRSIFHQIEHTTPYHWPQNSRENHGDLFESQELKNSTKSEDCEYFRASGEYSEYDDYSGKDVSVHMIEKNTSKGVRIFVTKKNTSNADLQKEYERFREEFKGKDVDQSAELSLNRRRRDIEEELLKRYQRFQQPQTEIEQNFDDTPVTKNELKEMLSKLFLHRLTNLIPVTKYRSNNRDKFIFKKDEFDNVNEKSSEFQSAYNEFIQLKNRMNEITTPLAIKTNFKDGIYRWNKKLNHLEKINS